MKEDILRSTVDTLGVAIAWGVYVDHGCTLLQVCRTREIARAKAKYQRKIYSDYGVKYNKVTVRKVLVHE